MAEELVNVTIEREQQVILVTLKKLAPEIYQFRGAWDGDGASVDLTPRERKRAVRRARGEHDDLLDPPW